MFDEDGDKPPDFLGKVAIPLLSVSYLCHAYHSNIDGFAGNELHFFSP